MAFLQCNLDQLASSQMQKLVVDVFERKQLGRFVFGAVLSSVL